MIDKSWCYSYWKGQKQNMNKETGKRTTTEKVRNAKNVLRLDDTEWRRRKGMRIR